MALRAVHARKWKGLSPELRVALSRYPRAVTLPDGATARLRPLESKDAEGLVTLFIDIPYDDLRNLHDNVGDPVIVRRWCRYMNYDRVLPIIAEMGGRIVGDATLHRRPVGPARGVGKFRAYVHPEYRRRGIGTVLLQEILDLAAALQLTQLAVELYQGQQELRKIFLRYGFRDAGELAIYHRVVLVRDLPAAGAGGDEPDGAPA